MLKFKNILDYFAKVLVIYNNNNNNNKREYKVISKRETLKKVYLSQSSSYS